MRSSRPGRTFKKANANAPTTHHTQYFEMISNRGIFQDGWYANTTPPHGPWILNAPLPTPNEYKWELYDLREDYTQFNDLAAKLPDKLKEMRTLFDQEAAKYNVLPLDNRTFAWAVEPRPSTTAGKTVFTYSGVNPGIATSNAPGLLGRSYTITADVDVPEGGGDGMIVTTGGRRLWVVSAQRQGGVRLQHADPRSNTAGKERSHSPRATTRSCTTTPTMVPVSPKAVLAS